MEQVVEKGVKVRILKDGRDSKYFDGREGVVIAGPSGEYIVVEVALRSGRKIKWIGNVIDVVVL